MADLLKKLSLLKGNQRLKRVRDISSTVLSVLLGLLGFAFAFSCTHIFFTRPAPAFSREVVGVYLAYLLVPSIIVILGVIAVGVMTLLLCEPKEKIRAEKDSARDLRRIYEKHAFAFDEKYAFGYGESTLCLGENKEAIKKAMLARFLMYTLAASLAVIFALIALFTAVNFQRFDMTDINGDVLSSSLLLFPLAFITLGLIYIVIRNTHKIKAAEVNWLKGAIKENVIADNSDLTNFYKKIRLFNKNILPKAQNVITVVILVLGIVFVILGSQNGGMAAVLEKAARICTECIGLG